MDTHAVGRDGVSAAELAESWPVVVEVMQRKLRNSTYEFTSYKEKLISKGASSSPRVVSIPTARDRVVLKSLALLLAEIFPHAKTPMAQVRIVELVKEIRLGRFDSFVRIDLRNFYPSIRHHVVREQLHRRIKSPALVDLFTKAISAPTVPAGAARPKLSRIVGVPQGLPISNPLAELAMAAVDEVFSGSGKNFRYFRYVDDVLLLCFASDANQLFDRVASECSRSGLTVHPIENKGKSQIGKIVDGFEYLGYRFRPDQVSVRRASVQKLETTIVQLFSNYRHRLLEAETDHARAVLAQATRRRLDLVIAGCVFEQVPRGWIHYFSQLTDMTLVFRLDAFVARMVRRFDFPVNVPLKSFRRALWHISHPKPSSSTYIPNFDKYEGVDKREFLEGLFPKEDFSHLQSHEISDRFRSEVRRLVSMMERDISAIS